MSTVATVSDPLMALNFDEMEATIASLPAYAPEIVHHFAPGVYAREMRAEGGRWLTGKMHKTEHVNIIVGDVIIYNDEDKTERRITGHACFVSKPGKRCAALTIRPTIWTTIHVTNETDLAKLEAALIEPHHNPLLADALAGRMLE